MEEKKIVNFLEIYCDIEISIETEKIKNLLGKKDASSHHSVCHFTMEKREKKNLFFIPF